MKRFFLALILVMVPLCAFAQNDTIYISTLSTTHLMFESDLTYVDISNKVVAAKIIDSNKSVLAIKAREAFDFRTSVSALESNGTMHTFIVAYDESPKRLILDYRNSAIQMVQSSGTSKKIQHSNSGSSNASKHGIRKLYHIADKGYGITFYCDDIYIDNDISTFSICLENKSGILYDCSEAIFVVENRKRFKRAPVYEKQQTPVAVEGSLIATSGDSSFCTFRFDKLSITHDQILKVYLYEVQGSRNFILTMNPNDVNKARKR